MYGSKNKPATEKQRGIIQEWGERQAGFIQAQPPISLTEYANGISYGSWDDLKRMSGTELEAYIAVLLGLHELPMSSATASEIIDALHKPLSDSGNASRVLRLAEFARDNEARLRE